MKKNLLLLLLLISFSVSAQLDREHWFGPMSDRVSLTSTPNYQSIYMSTGETTPFKVDIYFDNVVIASFMVGKNNPQKYKIPSSERDRIIVNNRFDDPINGLFVPVKMGFYLKGEKPFFASLRFSIQNHGEIQTSKGTAALGTEFRAVVAPTTSSTGSLGFMTSVLATEDNTTVRISEFRPDVIFSDEIAREEFNFSLNKGQSYIIEGGDSFYENETGFIGAKIVSDKPVIVTNGNFNGQYSADATGISDILMDQAVPINKLGKTFALVKGNGENSYDYNGTLTTMEKALIVAVRDSTKIYLNGNPLPAATINAGEFFETPPGSYVDRGSSHFNMFITSSEDIYVYQLLAGLDGFLSAATGGFNYIPPLSCYLPRKIDEIGSIDENEYTSNRVDYSLTVPTRLNIITEKGAVIQVKSSEIIVPLTAANGPHPVGGNTNWVTYSIPNISGNISLISSGALTAGITAGNDAVGYGGYFAGFSAIPLIVKVAGECLPGVRLETTEGFTSYQWLIKEGNNYVPLPGETNYYFNPTKAGIYAIKIKQASCPEVQTEDFKFFNCTTFTSYNYTTCSAQTMTPKFVLSTQTINPATVTVTTPPKNGTVIIGANGDLTYTANKNFSGIDHFFYSFCGTDPIQDCETVQAIVNVPVLIKENVKIDINGSTITVYATGANPPYLYAISKDNASPTYQTSNVFLNVPGGNYKITVQSADNCTPLVIAINVIQLFNVITPNNDGINDILDYSGLLKKENASLKIFDRYGNQVFKGDQNNEYSWDGKMAGRTVASGSYWFLMSWVEPDLQTLIQYKGWIMVKTSK